MHHLDQSKRQPERQHISGLSGDAIGMLIAAALLYVLILAGIVPLQ
jgi:hypothetical protein